MPNDSEQLCLQDTTKKTTSTGMQNFTAAAVVLH